MKPSLSTIDWTHCQAIGSQAISSHGINAAQVLAAFVFGSHARNDYRPGSDVDLIFLVERNAICQRHIYSRFQHGEVKIDSNVIRVDDIGELLSDPNWSYRFCTAQAIPGIGSEKLDYANEWIHGVQRMIGSESAMRQRIASLTVDARALTGVQQKLDTGFEVLRRYILAESVLLARLMTVEAAGLVPFQSARIEEQVVMGWYRIDPIVQRAYRELLSRCGIVFEPTDAYRADPLLQVLNYARVCRRITEGYFPAALGMGYGALLKMVGTDQKLLGTYLEGRGIEPWVAVDSDPKLEISNFLAAVLDRHSTSNRKPTRKEIYLRPKKELVSIDRQAESNPIRYCQYDSDRLRLKVIIPTGGCRVPTCTFCMLPLIASEKRDIQATLDEVEKAATGRVDYFAVYTDGSFFDKRELTSDDQVRIFATATKLNATELLVETLPMFLSEERLEACLQDLGACKLRIGIGLQSSSDEIRRYSTRTPIGRNDLDRLKMIRLRLPIRLRVYLLAGKPLLSQTEDLADILSSLRYLQELLTPHDVVTINPMIPTEGTFSYQLGCLGLLRYDSTAVMNEVAKELNCLDLPFRVEFGPVEKSTCSTASNDEASQLREQHNGQPVSAANLPWSVLGSIRERFDWASSLMAAGAQQAELFR